ncbi:hypothetical protein SDC9_153232 [bioreactor metagenome]|uniref:Uncharacterized protein n=1 Tax=bioreactor metagenome TaxID=1076179 RepID=A0A645EVA9_9ZZZZ
MVGIGNSFAVQCFIQRVAPAFFTGAVCDFKQRKTVVVGGGIQSHGLPLLPEIALAARLLRPVPRLAERGQQHRSENRNDCDHDQQFN